ncbi:MAG: hypothetical protein ACLRFL_00925 [Clostridia bacterium]
MENNTQENLIVKKFNLLSAIKNVGKRSLIALMLASMLATTPACTPRDNDPNTNENGNENNNENQNNNGNQNGGSQNGQTNKYSEYSSLLQGVLTSTEYNSLISQFKIEAQNNGCRKILNYIHPFGFLEDEGFDISAIKAGNLECHTSPFIYQDEPNNLYMALAVKDGSHYVNYLLKYQLSDQEMNEYRTFTGKYATYQAYFFNDAISRAKTPTIVSEVNVSSDTFNSAHHRYFTQTASSKIYKDIVYGENIEPFSTSLVILTDYDLEAKNFSVFVVPRIDYSRDLFIESLKVGKIQLKVAYGLPIEIENDVFIDPDDLYSDCEISATNPKDAYVPIYSSAVSLTDITKSDTEFSISNYT